METSPIYNVVIRQNDVTINKLEPDQRGYAKANRDLILRERDAIELFQRRKTEGGDYDGTYSFRFLETAKTFAMLRLKTVEEEIEDSLDKVQTYNGDTPSTAS